MTDTPKPDLSEYEEEEEPFDSVMRKLLAAKPAHKTAQGDQPKDKPAKPDKP